MKRMSYLAGFCFLNLAALALCGSQRDGAPAQENQDRRDARQTIPLTSIYSTGSQRGLKENLDASIEIWPDGTEKPADPYTHDLKRLLNERLGGATNIFLVTGDDIAQAINATHWTYSAEEPGEPRDNSHRTLKSNKIWLVVYLGPGHSFPPSWEVQSITINEKTINLRVTGPYKKPGPTQISTDSIKYFYWIPLGELKAGVYELKLFDSDLDRLTLSRWVEVR